MHGLINRSIQCFLRDTYGASFWQQVTQEARLGIDGFEAMLDYDDALSDAVIAAAGRLLDRGRDGLLEDLGTYLVTGTGDQGLRRLLRFGGPTFADFLHSLDEMPERARLALPDIELPTLEVVEHAGANLTLWCRFPLSGAGHVIVGLLRAMADDYGALCLVEHRGETAGAEVVGISLAAAAFAAPRPFDLAMPPV
ncbi:MAG: heme NO-binding domain-containing protein [Gemmobacter sp.]